MSFPFTRPSLTIGMNTDYFRFDDGYLYGPSRFDIPSLRFYIHEVLHFWQILSESFLTKLALAEWQAMVDHTAGRTVGKWDRLVGRFVEKHQELGFSSFDLHEALARYWDIHIIGPVKIFESHKDLKEFEMWRPLFGRLVTKGQYSDAAFDFLMQIEAEAFRDTYALPYRKLREILGQDTLIAFPILGYFALQSPDPVKVFASTAEKAGPILAPGRSEARKKGVARNFHIVWREIFPALKQVCASCCETECGVALDPGWKVIAGSALQDNGLYRHYSQLVRLAFGLRREEFWEFCFALPGDLEARGFLVDAFRPPLTRFRNGRWTVETPFTKMAVTMGSPGQSRTSKAVWKWRLEPVSIRLMVW